MAAKEQWHRVRSDPFIHDAGGETLMLRPLFRGCSA